MIFIKLWKNYDQLWFVRYITIYDVLRDNFWIIISSFHNLLIFLIRFAFHNSLQIFKSWPWWKSQKYNWRSWRHFQNNFSLHPFGHRSWLLENDPEENEKKSRKISCFFPKIHSFKKLFTHVAWIHGFGYFWIFESEYVRFQKFKRCHWCVH